MNVARLSNSVWTISNKISLVMKFKVKVLQNGGCANQVFDVSAAVDIDANLFHSIYQFSDTNSLGIC